MKEEVEKIKNKIKLCAWLLTIIISYMHRTA